MSIEETLIGQYGPLLTTSQLAKVLNRSPEGLRISLRSSSAWVSQVNSSRLRLGRRVYFRTAEIALILTGSSGVSQ
jgi:hypothetical protein